MKTKFLFPALSILSLVLLAFIAVTNVGADEPALSIYEATLIPSCSAAGFENCEVVVGNMVFQLEVAEGETVYNELLKFPLSPPAPEENAFFSREDILCDDPEQIAVAKYDEISKKWVLLSSDRQQPPEPYAARDGAYQISAQIGEPGIYAVVQKTQELISEIGWATDYCKRRVCGVWRGFETFPESGKVNQGGEVNLSFCNMFMGCDATGNGDCDEECPEGTDPDCGVCTVEEGDCCDMTQGNGCDPDCWVLEKDGVAVDSTDVDCVENVELYKPVTEDEEMTSVSKKIILEPGLNSWKPYKWDLINEQPGYSVLLEGLIHISGGVSIKNFTYVNLKGEETRITYFDRLQNIPPTAIKEIHLMANRGGNSNPELFINISLDVHKGDADPDKDNYSNYEDCNDNNKFIYPGAQEIENGVDDNCNSYNVYNPSSSYPVKTVSWRSQGHCWNWEACALQLPSVSIMSMPCNGYLEFTNINDVSYLEVWKQNAAYPCTLSSSEESSFITDNTGTKIGLCNAGLQGPWNSFQAVFSYGGSEEATGFECGNYCAPKSFASCQRDFFGQTSCTGAMRIASSTHFNAWNRDGYRFFDYQEYCDDGGRDCSYMYDEYPVYRSDLNVMNSPEKRVELDKGDVIYAALTGETPCNQDCDDGEINYKIQCYSQVPPADVPDSIDEGIATAGERRPTTIHVCKTDDFDTFAQTCIKGEICSFETNTESGSCEYNVPGDAAYGAKPLYTWVCRDDGECYDFYSSADDIRVCALSEQCSGVVNPELNIDLDCDGLMPYTPITNEAGEVTGMDRTKPLDPDCQNVSITGDCDFTNKKWYKSAEEGYVTDGYCQVCGDRDSTCTKVCEAGQKSCGGGCLPDTCDIAAGKWCSAGSWTEIGYCGKCGTIDEDCSSVTCASAACDIVSNHTCYSSNWRDTRGGVAYCDVPSCKAKDASCASACEAGACDTYLNAYCTTLGTWSANNAANYCAECGAVDADCGTGTCLDRHCDIDSKKVCVDGIWKDSMTDYCNECSPVDESSCLATCPPVEEWADTETNCTDGIDNDCKDGADCTDPVCIALDVCLNACPSFGVTTGCGNNLGICSEGSHTCGMDGRWSECILPPGGRLPEIEICNGEWDDDCDGTIDEGCVCTTGESMVCGQDSGSCRAGVKRCVDGKWDYCYRSSRASPTTEICDGFDNDCDGEIDEACPCDESSNQTCGGTPGTICKAGLRTCNDGLWGVCAGEIKPLTENSNTPGTCTDSIDNDCDGKIDATDDTCSVTPLDQLTPSCNDLKKNQHETGTDCGGECPPCSTPGPATCNNKKMDGDEEGRDCGGSCSISCDEQLRSRTAPSEEDTVDDTISEPVCGDASCDEGEAESCPDDCATSTTSSLSGFLIPGIIILVILGGAFAAYKTGLIKLKGKQQTKQSFPTPKGMQSSSQQTAKSSVSSGAFKAAPKTSAPRKEIKTKEELELEKSFKEESELLKK